MPSQAFPFMMHVVAGPADASIPAGPTPEGTHRELLALSTVADETAKPRRMFVQLSAREYEGLALVAVKTGTTPQHLLRNVLSEFLECVERRDGSEALTKRCAQTKSSAEAGLNVLGQYSLRRIRKFS